MVHYLIEFYFILLTYPPKVTSGISTLVQF
jgi:hypothetical protein